MPVPGDLLLVTGPPGAGKSTVCALLRASRVLVAGDHFFDLLGDSLVAPWLPGSHDQNEVVVSAAAAAAGRFVHGGYTVVYDGMIGPWFLPAFLSASGLESLHYAVVLPPLETCLQRVRTRVGHGFTDADAARHMYADFVDSAPDPRHVIATDAGTDAAQVADSVAQRWAAGTLVVGRS